MRKIKNACLMITGYGASLIVAILVVKLVAGGFILAGTIIGYSIGFYACGLLIGVTLGVDEQIEIWQKKVPRGVFLCVIMSALLLIVLCFCTVDVCCSSGLPSDEIIRRCSDAWGGFSGMIFGMFFGVLLSAIKRKKGKQGDTVNTI